MNIVVEDSGPCRKVLKVAVPGEGVREEYQHWLGKYTRKAQLDGFRPGRAPAALVERKFSDALKKETAESLVTRAYRKALEETKIEPINILEIRPDDLDRPDAPWNVAFTVEVAPEFDLPAYQGIPLKRQSVEVAEADVDAAVEELRMARATYEDLSEGPAEAEDLMAVDFEATVDGRPMEEVLPEAKGIGKAENFWTHLGRFSALPGFVEPFIGARVGEERIVQVEFPNDYAVAAVRGRSARYTAKVRALRRRRPAELNEAFLKEMGAPTVEELRNRVRRSLLRAREADEHRRLRNELAEFLVRSAPMDLPEEELRHAVQREIHEVVASLIRQGMTEEQVKEEKDSVFETARRVAEKRLRLRFILEKIARIEKIQVAESEVDREVEYLASSRGEDPAALRKRLEDNGGLVEIERYLLQMKATDFLLANAKVES